MSDGAAALYARAQRVLWRQGPDRVLVRRVSGEALDLLGMAAMVWVALDSPRTVAGLIDELAEFVANTSGVEATLHDLLARGLVEAVG